VKLTTHLSLVSGLILGTVIPVKGTVIVCPRTGNKGPERE